ncbi:MAG: hypothetical protein ACE5E5_16785, partial [Phycisphaerae bacterium]
SCQIEEDDYKMHFTERLHTLTLASDLTVHGGNGDVALRVQDSATIDVAGSQVVLTGGTTHTVTVIVTDSGAIKAHD